MSLASRSCASQSPGEEKWVSRKDAKNKKSEDAKGESRSEAFEIMRFVNSSFAPLRETSY